MKQFKLSERKILAGVCGGLAEYINVEPILVRAIFIILTVFIPALLAVYLLMWIIMSTNN